MSEQEQSPQEKAVKTLRRYLGPGATEDEHGEAILVVLAERDALRAEVERLRLALSDEREAHLTTAAAMHEFEAGEEKAEAALRRIAEQGLGEETWEDLLAVATGCIADARAALDTAPAEEGKP
jgi:hypothetical protein